MEEALIKRILPHSIEAEQSVIGSMILDRDAILVASEILTSDDFYQKQYGIIFDAMVELCNEGQPVDLITLQNRLKEKELPPDISSMEYVRDLIAAVPTSANVKYYANIVSEKAVLRRLIRTTEEVANACYLEKDSTETILEESEKKLFNILQRTNGSDYVPIQQVVLNAVSNIEKASKLKGSVTGIPTGFVDLDYKTSGMHASDLVLIAARPSMGKTAFVLNIAQYMAFRKDVTVAIFSLEMSKEQLVNRLLSMESGVDAQKLRNGNLSDTDWERLVEGAEGVARSNLIIDDTDHPLIIKVASIQAARRQVYFIDNDDYFQHRQMVADENGVEYTDNDERAIFYARGVLETVKKLRWCPDVIHCQGWMSAFVPLYIKKAYQDEPSFRDSKVVFSVFGDDFKSEFQGDLVEKLMLKGIERSDVDNIIKTPANYEELCKLAIAYSDGVIQNSEKVNENVMKFARESGIPVLDYQSPETYVDAFNNFYDEVWEFEKK